MVPAAPAVPSDTPPRRPRLDAFRAAFTTSFALAVAAAGYAWVRAAEVALFPRADPRAIVAVTEGGYLTRCALAMLIGGMGAFGGWALGARPQRGARALSAVVVFAAAAIGLQAGLAP